MSESRVKKSMKNSAVGIASQLILSIIAFVSRTVFINTLGVEYLGVSSLYSNILNMLSLSDLGIYTVMLFSLYKPLANKDESKIAALITYYKKLYWIIAGVVLFLGLGCIPFLNFLIKDSTFEYRELLIYYILYLMISLCSYIAVSKVTLLRADQNAYIVQISTTATTICMDIIQIVLLLTTRNFLLYLIMQIAFVLGNNIILSLIADRKYPFLKKKSCVSNKKELHDSILKNIKSTLIYKVSGMMMNSTDNILISVILGTAVVGYYSNYVTIFSLVNKFIMILINAIMASIGNFLAIKSKEEKYNLFNVLLLGFYFIATLCCGCYLCGMQDFISIWIGEEFLLSKSFLYALVFYRFVYCVIHPLWMFRESSGLFIYTKYVTLFAAVVNIVLSVILGNIMGLSGIIVATAISYLVTVFWYEPKVMCKNMFFSKFSEYCKKTIILVATSVPCLIIGWGLGYWETDSIFILLIKFGVQFIITTTIFLSVHGKTQELATIASYVKTIKKI